MERLLVLTFFLILLLLAPSPAFLVQEPALLLRKLHLRGAVASSTVIKGRAESAPTSAAEGGGGGGWMRMQLVHRDFSNSEAGNLAARMKLAVQRSRRRLHFFQESVQSAKQKVQLNLNDKADELYEAPLFSSGHGSYLTFLTIGKPGIRFTAIMDTGSNLVWTYCQPWEQRNRQNNPPIFDPSRSSTYKMASCNDSLCQSFHHPQCSSASTCQYKIQYGDDSTTSGDFAYDTLTISDSSSQSHIIPFFGFGCAYNTTRGEGGFGSAGGLVGLGQGPLSLTSQLSIHKFSYCLVSTLNSTSQTSPMFLGDTAILNGPGIQSTPIITSPLVHTYYYIALKGISVGGNILDIPSGAFDLEPNGTGGMVIDSGTTLTFLFRTAYQPLLSAFESATELPRADGSLVGLDLCYRTTGPVPSLTFHFDGADIDFPTANYFVNFDGLFCLAMGSSTDISIFGNIQQQNYQFLYDTGAKKLTFVPATCDRL